MLNITLASNNLVDQIDSWKVSQTPSFSDHRCIEFGLASYVPKVVRYRNPRRTNWEQYRNFLRQHVEDKLSTVIPSSPDELNDAVNGITALLTEAYEFSCPEVKAVRRKDGKLWSYEIEGLRKTARKAWNKARKSALDADWNVYKMSQKTFRKAVHSKAKQLCKKFCAEIVYVPDYDRIHKILAKDPRLLPGSLMRPDGNFTSCGKETATHLLETHFPDCSDERTATREPDPPPPSEEDWALANRIVTVDKWAIGRFKPYKSISRRR